MSELRRELSNYNGVDARPVPSTYGPVEEPIDNPSIFRESNNQEDGDMSLERQLFFLDSRINSLHRLQIFTGTNATLFNDHLPPPYTPTPFDDPPPPPNYYRAVVQKMPSRISRLFSHELPLTYKLLSVATFVFILLQCLCSVAIAIQLLLTYINDGNYNIVSIILLIILLTFDLRGLHAYVKKRIHILSFYFFIVTIRFTLDMSALLYIFIFAPSSLFISSILSNIVAIAYVGVGFFYGSLFCDKETIVPESNTLKTCDGIVLRTELAISVLLVHIFIVIVMFWYLRLRLHQEAQPRAAENPVETADLQIVAEST